MDEKFIKNAILRLTPQEMTYLYWTAYGKTPKEIAQLQKVTLDGYSYQMGKVYDKLRIRGLTKAKRKILINDVCPIIREMNIDPSKLKYWPPQPYIPLNFERLPLPPRVRPEKTEPKKTEPIKKEPTWIPPPKEEPPKETIKTKESVTDKIEDFVDRIPTPEIPGFSGIPGCDSILGFIIIAFICGLIFVIYLEIYFK